MPSASQAKKKSRRSRRTEETPSADEQTETVKTPAADDPEAGNDTPAADDAAAGNDTPAADDAEAGDDTPDGGTVVGDSQTDASGSAAADDAQQIPADSSTPVADPTSNEFPTDPKDPKKVLGTNAQNIFPRVPCAGTLSPRDLEYNEDDDEAGVGPKQCPGIIIAYNTIGPKYIDGDPKKGSFTVQNVKCNECGRRPQMTQRRIEQRTAGSRPKLERQKAKNR